MAQTWFTILTAFFQILAILCGLGVYHFKQKADNLKAQEIKNEFSNLRAVLYDRNNNEVHDFTGIEVLKYRILSQKGYMKIKVSKDYLNSQFEEKVTLKYSSGNYQPVMLTFMNNEQYGPGIIFISEEANKRVEVFWNRVFGAGSYKLTYSKDLYFDLYFNDYCLYVVFPLGGEATIQGIPNTTIQYAKDLTVNSIYNDLKGRNVEDGLNFLKEYFNRNMVK